jgi:hypothetical protein
MKTKKYCSLSIVALLLILSSSCKKFVEVPPPAEAIVNTSVYTTNASASAVLLGLYNFIMAQGQFANHLDEYSGLQSDELINYFPGNQNLEGYYTNTLRSNNVQFWQELYEEMAIVNSAIAGLDQSTAISGNVKNQLLGEAKFMRGFLYFYLTNLWGDVPLILSSSDYQSNNSAARTAQNLVYTQIIADLQDAQQLLSANFVGADAVTASTERTRPTKWAATALLARVYLYTGDWKDAAAQAAAVINEQALFGLATDLNSVFLANSNEAIWQLQPCSSGFNTTQAFDYILTMTPGTGTDYFSMSPNLYSQFEPGDLRAANWVGTYGDGTNTWYYPYKYKVNRGTTTVTEYLMVFRLAEQYLIRAEAEANSNDAGNALSDLNEIRNRAGLANYAGATDQTSLLAAILHERQVELFSEWGHRWLDLKRTGKVNAVMSVVTPQKGGTWSPDWALYPVPLSDIQIDPNLKQNPGY